MIMDCVSFSVAGLSPEAEPTPGDMQCLIAIIQKRACTLCIFETLTDPKIARLLAQETGAETAVFRSFRGFG